jgi:aspartyl-tRNA(Asn)/glutamyl-tRNA(Gln) amidotransferase subunit B
MLAEARAAQRMPWNAEQLRNRDFLLRQMARFLPDDEAAQLTFAFELEVERQIDVLESGGKIVQETRLYNGDTKKARSMRSKEDSNDYRYFPCPDLLPVIIDDDYIESVRRQMPELPEARRARFVNDLGLSDYDAGQLTADRPTADFFEATAKASGEAKLAANWIMADLAAYLNKNELSIARSPISPEQLAGLIARIKDGTISSKIAKQVFDAMCAGEGDADAIIEARGLKQVSDTGALEKIIDEVLASNQAQVDNYRSADPAKQPKMLGFFVGQIMKASKGQANPQAVNEILLKKLSG